MKKVVLSFMCAAMVFSGCGTMSKTGQGTLLGSGAGAIIGAGIGAAIGDGKGAAIGAAIGTAVGAGTGAVIGKKMDKKAAELEALERPYRIRTVSRPSRSPSTAVFSSQPTDRPCHRPQRTNSHSSPPK